MRLGFFFKPVFTFSKRERKIRLVRFGYNRKWLGTSAWISWVLSLTIMPKTLYLENKFNEWYIVLLGFGIHFRKGSGGYES